MTKKLPAPCDTCPCAGWGMECEGIRTKPEAAAAETPSDGWGLIPRYAAIFRQLDRPTAVALLALLGEDPQIPRKAEVHQAALGAVFANGMGWTNASKEPTP